MRFDFGFVQLNAAATTVTCQQKPGLSRKLTGMALGSPTASNQRNRNASGIFADISRNATHGIHGRDMDASRTDERTALLAGEGAGELDGQSKDDGPSAYGAGFTGLPWWKRPSVSVSLGASFQR